MILLLMMSKMTFSQDLLITNIQRDSIVSKIIRGNKAIAENTVLTARIVSKDSVIKIQTTIIGIQKNDLFYKDQQLENNKLIISNLKKMNTLEKKRGRRKGFFGFIKGLGVGVIGTLLLIL